MILTLIESPHDELSPGARASSELGLGVNLKQFAALTYLREGPRKQQDLGTALVCDPNMLVLILNALEEDGLAVRRRDPEDRRRHIVEATPKGLKALTRAEHQIESLEDTVLAELSEAERETLQRLLAKALAHAPKPVPA
jgi:DNA-binding MarR family transcriptional regulator